MKRGQNLKGRNHVMDDRFDISRFEEYREDNRLEVKRAKDRIPDSLWETYSSFANTGGGCIILGVKEREDGSWYTTGLKDPAQLKKDFFDTLHNPNKVNAVLVSDNDLTEYEIDGDAIIVIEVPKARREDKPVYINSDMWNGTYRRDGEGDYHCSREAILAMLRDQPEDRTDYKILESREMTSLEGDSIRSYRRRYDASHEGHPFVGLSDEDFLVKIGAASDECSDHKLHPTAAGLLMFGSFSRIIREFPDFMLDYYEMFDPETRWTDRLSSHSGDWSGNLYDFYTKVYYKLAADIKKPFQLEGMYRKDDTPAHRAVREALANCLSNADYNLPMSVIIRKYPDRIVFINPGTILLGRKQMLRGGISKPRNKLILNMLNYIGVGERAGSGVPDIYKIWADEEYEEPMVEEMSGREGTIHTIVTLPLVKKGQRIDRNAYHHTGDEKGDENRRTLIIGLMSRDPQISIVKISGEIGLTKRQVEKAIDSLKEAGIVRREGPAKGGRWIVTGGGDI